MWAIGLLVAVGALLVGCESGDEEARPAPTTTSTTTTTRTVARTCRPPVPPDSPDTTEIRVFFYCGPFGFGEPLVPVTRRIPKTTAVLQAVMEAFVRGPTPEEGAAGLRGGVPSEASSAPVRAVLRDRVAEVAIGYDLGSTSNFSASQITLTFYDALWANAFQFESVSAVDLIEQCPGEVECTPFPRSDWQLTAKPCGPSRPSGSVCPGGAGA